MNNAATPTFHVVNLGCKVNRVESDSFAAGLLSAGGHEAALESADLVIVNTCTVTGEAEKKTRKAVRHALRENACGRVVVTGCAAAIDPETYESMGQRVLVVPKGNMAALLEKVAQEPAWGEGVQAGQAAGAAPDNELHGAGAPAALRVGGKFPTRVGVKVQDGCDNACTYCIVHVARGRATSRPLDEIVAEVRELEAAGVREIVLTGINLGSYRSGGVRLAGLMEALLAATSKARFRISSVEPRDVDDSLIELMARSQGRICRHVHLPLQSGSDKVLKEMARPYNSAKFAQLVQRFYDAMPEMSISTDIIVGFPGETETDFRYTLALARFCKFSKIHVFRYSQRAGTPAAARADQIAPEVKAQRASALEALGADLRQADFERRAGTREWALVETDGVATTESYHSIPAPQGAVVGGLVECEL